MNDENDSATGGIFDSQRQIELFDFTRWWFFFLIADSQHSISCSRSLLPLLMVKIHLMFPIIIWQFESVIVDYFADIEWNRVIPCMTGGKLVNRNYRWFDSLGFPFCDAARRSSGVMKLLSEIKQHWQIELMMDFVLDIYVYISICIALKVKTPSKSSIWNC